MSLEVVCAAARPDDVGLDFVLIHGVKTLSLPPLTNYWSRKCLDMTPENTQILSFNADIQAENKFSWKEFDDKATALFSAIKKHHLRNKGRNNRPTLFVGYALAGILFKHALWQFSLTEHDWFVKHVQGIIFVATPHIKDTFKSSTQTLASILRYESIWTIRKPQIEQADLRSLATSSRRFEELKLDCPILSCYEQLVVRVGWPMNRRRVQLVDKTLAKTFAGKEISAGIDGALSDMFENRGHAVHDSILDFCTMVLRDFEKQNTSVIHQTSGLVPTRASSSATQKDASRNPSIDRMGDFSQSSSPKPTANTPQDTNLMSPLSTEQNTPLAHSPASDDSYVLVLSPTDVNVPDRVEFVQTASYERPNTGFKGREDVIHEMQRVLLPSSQGYSAQREARSFIICGHTGLGKTQIASHFFHSYKDKFDVVFWVQANSRETLAAAFNQIAVKLGIHSKETLKDPLQKRQLVIDWLRVPVKDSTKTQTRLLDWLLVFDGADKPNILVDYWPNYASGSVIVTTRDPTLRRGGEYGHEGFDMTPLPVPDAVSLLQLKLPRPMWEKESDSVLVEVVQALSCWPIAIVQMAGNMELLNQTPSRFLENYKNERKRSRYFEHAQGFRDGYSTAISTLWNFSNPESEAARLLSVMSLLLPETIPEVILTQDPEKAQLYGFPVERTDYDFAILELVTSSTIGRAVTSTQDNPEEITIHAFVQEVIRSRLFKEEHRLVETFTATVKLVMTVWPYETLPRFSYYEHNNYDTWRHRDRIIPHMTHLWRVFQSFDVSTQKTCASEEFLNMLSETAWYHFQRFNLDQAQDFVQATLEVHKKAEKEYPRIVAGQYGTWAQVAIVLNKMDLACEKSTEALRIRNAIYAETKIVFSQLVASYATLGRVKAMTGQLEEARALIVESIRLRKEMPKFSQLQLYTPLVYLAFVEFMEGKMEIARARLTEALEHREEEYGKDDTKSPRTGLLLLYLGIVHDEMGQFEQALAFLRRAYNQLREVAGDDDFNTAEVCYKLASLHLRKDTIGSAQTMIERAVVVFSRSKYHIASHARALFLKYKVLKRAAETDAADHALIKCSSLHRQLVPGDNRSREFLSEDDFNHLLPAWFR